MLLMNPLGGIDLRLILLGYCWRDHHGIFYRSRLRSGFHATRLIVGTAAGSVLWMMAWLMGPFFVSQIFTRVVFRLPDVILTVNAWVLTSSPLGLMFKIASGMTSSSRLINAVAWMSGLQVGGGALLIVWRSFDFARLIGGASVTAARAWSDGSLARLALAPKPPVGDDPILWREMNLARSGFLAKAFGLVVTLGMYCRSVTAPMFSPDPR